jgi:ATP phosphoribosyltransferase regulatory subunit
METAQLQDVVQALSEKDVSALAVLTARPRRRPAAHWRPCPLCTAAPRCCNARRRSCLTIPWYARRWPTWPGWPTTCSAPIPNCQVGFDLSDLSGYAYYSGPRFALYGADWSDALVRGGRYDEVGAIFGRNRPAVGFGLDLKALAEVARLPISSQAILAPWGEDAELRAAVRRLREGGEVVVFALPGHAPEAQAVACDRELVSVHGRWAVLAR